LIMLLAAGPLALRGREWGVDGRGRPSLTARNVATIRLALGRPALASGDPEGEDRLARSLRAPLPWQLPGMAAYIAARTEFFDNRLLQACELGCQQVVIVGAGYDGRSLRFRQPGVTFYEVDHPTTQAGKLARLGEVAASAEDVRFVAADIRRDSLIEALTMAGARPSSGDTLHVRGLDFVPPYGASQQSASVARVPGSAAEHHRDRLRGASARPQRGQSPTAQADTRWDRPDGRADRHACNTRGGGDASARHGVARR
jgi:Leucine carboxyl methyltransferase